ncbi:MAG: leucyl/phenylalanyl-tRNA--protein transferase [Bdellovibrionales bacterium]
MSSTNQNRPPFAPLRRFFPDPRLSLTDGLVMVGGALSLENLLEAYSFGIFPWPQEGLPVLWFSPERRGILEFKSLHWSKSFQKFLRQTKWRITANQNFVEVIRACAQAPRPGQSGTWITPDIEKAYLEFHRAGYAHSIECWQQDQLVGGLYGVYVANLFAGESMFYRKDNASKYCLWWLVERLKAQGHQWMDTQMVTEGLKSLGGRYIPRAQFLRRLEEEKAKPFVPLIL